LYSGDLGPLVVTPTYKAPITLLKFSKKLSVPLEKITMYVLRWKEERTV
jgi:hypothetical protein